MKEDRVYKEFLEIIATSLPASEAEFFGNLDRLSPALSLIERYVPSTDSRILDLASGPVCLDFLLENRGYKNLTAVDVRPEYETVYLKSRDRNLIKYTHFVRSNLNGLSLEDNSVDMILLNDVLFYQNLRLSELLTKVIPALVVGGYLIFDIWTLEFYQRFQPIYDRLYPKYVAFKRYSLTAVTKSLNEYGMELMKIVPWYTERFKILQKLTYYFFHIANTVYLVSRKIRA